MTNKAKEILAANNICSRSDILNYHLEDKKLIIITATPNNSNTRIEIAHKEPNDTAAVKWFNSLFKDDTEQV